MDGSVHSVIVEVHGRGVWRGSSSDAGAHRGASIGTPYEGAAAPTRRAVTEERRSRGSPRSLKVEGSRRQMLCADRCQDRVDLRRRGRRGRRSRRSAMRARMRAYSARPCPSSSRRTAARQLGDRGCHVWFSLLSGSLRLADRPVRTGPANVATASSVIDMGSRYRSWRHRSIEVGLPVAEVRGVDEVRRPLAGQESKGGGSDGRRPSGARESAC